MICKNYYKCFICGKYSDDGDVVHRICLDCIDKLYETRCKNEGSEISENQQTQD